MASSNVEGFSLSHVQILDGNETFRSAIHRTQVTQDGWDVYGVREASMDVDTDDWANECDDETISRWQWINFVEIEVVTGFFGFKTYERLTRRNTALFGSGNSTRYGAELWHEDDANLPSSPLLLKMPARDDAGNIRDIIIGVYRFQPGPISVDGPQYKEGFSVSYRGTGIKSLVDETGTPFIDGKKRCATILSLPSGDPGYGLVGPLGSAPLGLAPLGGS